MREDATVTAFPEPKPELEGGYWGLCPRCRQNDGCFTVGKDHWYVCHQHLTRWWVGANLFSTSWQDMSELEREREEVGLARYREVEPWHHPLPDDDGIDW